MAADGEFRGRGVGDFNDLAQVVEDGSGQGQVPVQVGVDVQRGQGMAGHEPGVLQQAAEIGVVVEAGRGGYQEGFPVLRQKVKDQVL